MRSLTDDDLSCIVHMTLNGYKVKRVRAMRGPCADSDHYGVILGRNASGNNVTWQFHLDENDQPVTYWSRYFGEDLKAAARDFNNRDLDGAPVEAEVTGCYNVTITETLRRTVTVEAGSRDEAEQIVSDEWRAEKHILMAEDFTEVGFEAVEVADDGDP